MDEEPKDPLILGRPFLATAGAIIDVRRGKIELNLGKDCKMVFNVKDVMKQPTINGESFYIETLEQLADDYLEELGVEDKLQLALTKDNEEFGCLQAESMGYAWLMDSHRAAKEGTGFEELEESSQEQGTDDDWSELKAPKVDLKPLPKGLRYAFLGSNSTYPVIVNDALDPHELETLLVELRKYRRALGYSLDDIKGLSPTLCTHRIHLKMNQRDLLNISVPIHPNDQEKTTFTCPYGTFAYRRMPFGLCNAPATFQRAMLSIFSDLIEEMVEVFMDDFSVYGSSFSSCLSNLCRVLKRCEETGLVLNWEKCHFMVKEGIVLGHKISEKGIEVDKAKIEVMVQLGEPKSVKDVRSFLGHAGFYRRYQRFF
ncbi:unnamed protein product [Microthlaspi erraticum]|uniref:Reverse transcriptase domain-containing protein n=1 Tax=Microthlaspi erraticum TaxID=1685480 RepID=A0A6D2HW78_9BRAS|nr:unnamed protein product [Microthlaspi erraticum]